MLQDSFTSNEQFEAHYIDLISMLSLMRVQIRDIDQVSDSFARRYLSVCVLLTEIYCCLFSLPAIGIHSVLTVLGVRKIHRVAFKLNLRRVSG